MKPDHRVLLCCALAWLCCAAVVVKSEDELLDGNAVKEGNSVGSEWPERDESGVINILKQMYRDLQEKPFYADDDDKPTEETCFSKCGVEKDDTSKGIKCITPAEEGDPITCTCEENKKFDYEKKECQETCLSKCGVEKDDTSKGIKCITPDKEEDPITCTCEENKKFDYEKKECQETCLSMCGVEEDDTSIKCIKPETDEGPITCTCEESGKEFHYEKRECQDCDCGPPSHADSCKFDKENNHVKVCACQSGYKPIDDKCRSSKCTELCGFPESVKTGVICEDTDADADVACSCNDTKNKFDNTKKECKECDCGIHTCSFEDGKEVCECKEGYDPSSDGKCKIPNTLCEENCGKASGVICDPASTLENVTCSCDDPEKKNEYDHKNKTCRETCDSDEKCANGAKCLASEEGNENKFCQCLKDTSGDFCKNITECGASLIRCIGKNGKCTYNATTEKAYCECPAKHSFDATIGYCETCDCGVNAEDCFFVKGDLNCKCKEKFAEKNKTCERCDCGEGAQSCHFDSNGKKTCECKEKHKEDRGTCKLCDCGERSTSCKFEEGAKKCECEKGYEGTTGTCKAPPICIDTCGEIDKEFTCNYNETHAHCECPKPKQFDYEVKRCRIVCGGEDVCKNGANCTEDKVNKANKFCSCLPGTFGDACDDVDDCIEGGKYENCTEEKGDCSYNIEKNEAECKCEGIKKLKDLGGYCEVCDCGTNSENCSFKNDEKDCKCKADYKDNNGTCEACVCGENSTNCDFKDGKKKCSCKEGFADNKGTCEACDCGPNSNECSFVEGKKTCKCKDRFSENNGACEACYCGVNQESCSFENEKQICKCKKDYSDNSGECKACNCGGNSTKCSFNETGEIECECARDFAQKHDKCEECKCGKFTKPCRFKNDDIICECKENYGKKGDNCTACECGEHSIGCEFEKEDKTCICKEGYGSKDGQCKVDNCFKKCGKPHHEVKCVGDHFGPLEEIKCTCEDDDLKFDYKEKKCRLTCSGDECQNGAPCGTRNDHKFCLCLNGTRGDFCKVVIECQKGGKFEKCSGGERGDCIYDKEHEKPKCTCPKDRLLDNKFGYCQRTCKKDDDCSKEGKQCHPKGYCTCEGGKEGDNCEIILGCTKELKSKCENAKAKCIFDRTAPGRATCKCNSENYSFDREKGQCISKFCKDIGCNGAKCDFEDGTNTGYCKCDKGFYNYKNGKCEEPDKCLLRKTPCKENFVCVKGECKCNYKKDGDKCNRTFCEDTKSCFTGGQCVNPDVQSYTCSCKDKNFYTGSECKDTKCILKEFQKDCPCPREMERKEDKCVPKGNSKSCDKACGYGYCVDDQCLCVSLSKNVNGTCVLDASKVCATKKLTKDSSKCDCDGKYKQAKDGITCELITCSDDKAKKTCDAMGATCKMSWTGNSPGFYCDCPDGYVGDKDKNICTDPCSNIDISSQCIGMDHFCYNSYSDDRKRKGDCVCPPPLAADENGKCVKIAKYVYLMSNIPVIKKKYEMKQDIDHVRLNSHLIQSISQTFSEGIFDYGHLHDYEVKGSVVYCSVWIRFKKDPTIELKRYNFQAQKFPKETCGQDCDDSLYVWPPSLVLNQEDVTKVQFKNLTMCSPELKNRLCGAEAACKDNKCFCPKGFRPIEYSIRDIAPGIRILRCEPDKKADLNECELGTHACSENTTCFKVPGDYICPCKLGFQKSTVNDKEPCTDLCTPSPCKKGTCEMKDKLFNCICPKGYEGSVCDEEDASLAGAKNSTVIVGAVLGSLLAVLLIALFLMYRKMRESSYSEDFTPAPRQDHAAEMMERRPMRGVVNKSYE